MKKFCLVLIPALIAGCSSPATEAEIRAAVQECEAVMHDIENQIQPALLHKPICKGFFSDIIFK
ncbi:MULTISPECIES: hypothetical protein [Acinetobacter]|jgi:outer membrane murein-binding lipoprotein Lpp|uniref:Lipoprotein n=2 Tax=Acinetobacter calcoaceticus/baumannii complex TaxID=909768 RepID=A0A3A4HXL8_ACIBA|nr:MULTISPECIES: hypothetical protein [Acinetobacter calcoaceticus/baumannii complex]CAH1090735.1 Uncharacterised protein [Acinetobacter phage MD-2021a]AKQ28825.1 hypothetical protein ACX60_18930 [Acinetobacter baumannii]ARG33459.1 hypothetical protein B7L46_00305 [Acinetobacter baumannii]ASO73105.1 hypothetical protein Aba7804_20430 [Acinetobacter baumannii]AVN31651.1 hypothetical protein AM467_19515 [Acinetobacter baumannii]